jgi:transcriptional regulator with XRE-family HTH domain
VEVKFLFGDKLRVWMDQRNFSIRGLAEAIDSSPSTIQRILKGEQSPTEEMMNKISVALNVPLVLLIDGRSVEHVYALDEVFKDDPELAKYLANKENKPIIGLIKGISETKVTKEDLENILKLLGKNK